MEFSTLWLFFPCDTKLKQEDVLFFGKEEFSACNKDKFMYHYSSLHASKSGIEAQLRAHLLCSHLALRETFLLLQPRKSPFAVKHKTKYPPNPREQCYKSVSFGVFTCKWETSLIHTNPDFCGLGRIWLKKQTIWTFWQFTCISQSVW